jgi:hypothetical protein
MYRSFPRVGFRISKPVANPFEAGRIEDGGVGHKSPALRIPRGKDGLERARRAAGEVGFAWVNYRDPGRGFLLPILPIFFGGRELHLPRRQPGCGGKVAAEIDALKAGRKLFENIFWRVVANDQDLLISISPVESDAVDGWSLGRKPI